MFFCWQILQTFDINHLLKYFYILKVLSSHCDMYMMHEENDQLPAKVLSLKYVQKISLNAVKHVDLQWCQLVCSCDRIILNCA